MDEKQGLRDYIIKLFLRRRELTLDDIVNCLPGNSRSDILLILMRMVDDGILAIRGT